MTKLTALRQLRGEYGKVAPGQDFTTRDEIARSLIGRGLARMYETKVILPAPSPLTFEAPAAVPEVAALPFRHGDLSDAQPAEISAVRDLVLSTADVPCRQERVADRPRQRRGRKGLGTG